MIIKCRSLFNANTNEYHSGPSYNGFSLNSLYSVLEMYFNKDELVFRVFDDNKYIHQIPCLKRSNDFEVVSANIPKNWQLNRYEHGGTVLGPKSWNIFELWEESFWQDYCNSIPAAFKCFEEEVKIIFDTDREVIEQIDKANGRDPFTRTA